MARLLELGALPIINENDTIATAEIKVGDNDTLGAIVACCVKADLLVLLSDIEGLYTADPRKDPDAQPHPRGGGGHPRDRGPGRGVGSSLGAPRQTPGRQDGHRPGCDMVITNGEHPERLYDIAEGKRCRHPLCGT